VAQTRDKFPLFGPAGNGWVQRRIQNQLGLLKRRQPMKVAQELEEAHILTVRPFFWGFARFCNPLYFAQFIVDCSIPKKY
jgi:hypothetical protein